MLGQVAVNSFRWKYSFWGNPSSSPGVSVTPGASNSEGSWTQIASSANIAQDVYDMIIQVGGGNTSTAAKNHLLDIGVDPAGGTSYTAVISNIACGASPPVTTTHVSFRFPLWIKAGSSVAVRVQGSNSTAGTVRVAGVFYGMPTAPHLIRVGQYSETVATISSSNGTSFTPVSGSEGSWASMGATSKNCWWWQLGVQIDNGTITAMYVDVELGYGSATVPIVIIADLRMAMYGTAEIIGVPSVHQLISGYCDVPAGSTLYVRGYSSAAVVSGFNATAIGIGG
jgi:hypothetical protein